MHYRTRWHVHREIAVPQKMKSIPFRPELIRKIRSGDKTQTRRPTRPSPPSVEAIMAKCGASYSWEAPTPGHPYWHVAGAVAQVRGTMGVYPMMQCPYGGPGATLWVKEALHRDEDGIVRYQADDALVRDELGKVVRWTWKPKKLGAMYCPRWASRTELELVRVGLTPLVQISEEEAKAEGVEPRPPPESAYYCDAHETTTCGCVVPTAYFSDGFEDKWKEIHGDDAWSAECWVWALEFKIAHERA